MNRSISVTPLIVYSSWHTALKEDDGKADDVVKQLRGEKANCLKSGLNNWWLKVAVNDDWILKLVGMT